MSQEGVEVGEGYNWAGGPRELLGRSRGRGGGFAVPGDSIRNLDLPPGWHSSPSERRVTATCPRAKCGLLEEKRGLLGQGSEARGYLAGLLL